MQDTPKRGVLFGEEDFPVLGAGQPSLGARPSGPAEPAEPAAEPPQEHPNLEERLRGMILHNLSKDVGVELAGGDASPPAQSLPPHMLSATEEEKAWFIAQRNIRGAPPSAPAAQQPSASMIGHRRMNQAYRKHNPTEFDHHNEQAGPGTHYIAGNATPHTFPPSYSHNQDSGGAHRAQAPPGPPVSLSREHVVLPPNNAPYAVRQHQWRGEMPPRGRGMQDRNYRRPSLDHDFRPPPTGVQPPHVPPMMPEPYHPLVVLQSDRLNGIALSLVAEMAISQQELQDKDNFRRFVEGKAREAITAYELGKPRENEFDPARVQLVAFGSIGSTFALKSSDMDVMLLSPQSQPPVSASDSPIPRLLEKHFLEAGWGARLLTRTRVPIIRLCEDPPDDLFEALKESREQRDVIPGSPADQGSPKESDTKDGISAGVRKSRRECEIKGNARDGTNGDIQKNRGECETRGDAEDDEEGSRSKREGKGDTGDHRETRRGQRGEDHNGPNSNPEAAQNDQAPRKFSLEELKSAPQRSQEDVLRYYARIKKTLGVAGDGNCLPHLSDDKGEQAALEAGIIDTFITGLRSEALQQRVRQHESVHGAQHSPSLVNAWIEIEGEQLIMAWESRAVREHSAAREAEGERIVQDWRGLHKRSNIAKAGFERILHRLWHKLKAMPSIKVEQLSQRYKENGQVYFSRCVQLLGELCGHEVHASKPSPPNDVQRQVMAMVSRRFVAGLRNDAIKQRLEDYLQTNVDTTLFDLGDQLEAEYRLSGLKKAIDGGSLGATEGQLVEDYAKLVREHGARSSLPVVTEAYDRIKDLVDHSAAAKAPQLEFPSIGAGILCDVNFSNHLALHNTVLLRCYSHCDARVRPLVLAVKAWAKLREINSPYRGTLSSYGYVLMVLHFLANVAFPPVVPNLQLARKPSQSAHSNAPSDSQTMIEGYDVRFWRNEAEIIDLARKGMLTQNRCPLGLLLRQFFEYYTAQGPYVIGRGFNWSMDVVSLRTRGGLLTKQAKNWTGARTTVAQPSQPGQQKKEVRHRYLFAVEDPFEVDHNIARTVTHNGIVAIRGEFRRAWKIISNFGMGQGEAETIEEVFQPICEHQAAPQESGKGVTNGDDEADNRAPADKGSRTEKAS